MKRRNMFMLIGFLIGANISLRSSGAPSEETKIDVTSECVETDEDDDPNISDKVRFTEAYADSYDEKDFEVDSQRRHGWYGD